MKKIETISDFKQFLNNNRDKIAERAVKLEELPADDEWIRDTDWDRVYENEVLKHGKI